MGFYYCFRKEALLFKMLKLHFDRVVCLGYDFEKLVFKINLGSNEYYLIYYLGSHYTWIILSRNGLMLPEGLNRVSFDLSGRVINKVTAGISEDLGYERISLILRASQAYVFVRCF